MNAFTVDVEDWFCVNNFDDIFSMKDWPHLESRVENNTRRLLELLRKYKTRATFFVLGWVAEKNPDVVKDIFAEGHEIASHGYSHNKTQTLTREKFEEDLKKSLDIIETLISRKVIGYRAPSFSLTPDDESLFSVLLKNGIKYDSSFYPQSLNPSYGRFKGADGIRKMKNGLIEVGLNSIKAAGLRIPFSGGAYFRIYPYSLTKKLIKIINKRNIRYIFYIHPWEIDALQPIMKTTLVKKFRHYHNLKGNCAKLERLLNDFKFASIREILEI